MPHGFVSNRHPNAVRRGSVPVKHIAMRDLRALCLTTLKETFRLSGHTGQYRLCVRCERALNHPNPYRNIVILG